jgi:CRP/FNR family transcriptional regulator, cyclic AMP receptor protein
MEPGGYSAAAKRQVLADHFLFGELTPAERDTLLAYARVERYPAGRTIFLKGSPGRGMMAVLKGRVRISASSPEGREIVLNTIEEGEVFGEIALLDGNERSADATAAADCDLLVIDRRDFVPFIESHPGLALRLIAVLCQRLRRTTQQVEDVLFLDLPSRLAKKLLDLAATRANRTPEGLRFDGKLSQRELGNMIGLTRESVNKQLAQWQQEGVIAVEKGIITVLDEEELRSLLPETDRV